MNCNIYVAIISVIGTILGTILGWVLNNLSKQGKLHIYSTWSDSFLRDDDYGGMIECKSKEEVTHYRYKITLELHNSSGDPTIMRRIEILFSKNKKELFRLTPNDESKVHNLGPLIHYDSVQSLTIPANSVCTLKLRGGISASDDCFEKLWDVNQLWVTYIDEKNKEKKVLVDKIPIILSPFEAQG